LIRDVLLVNLLWAENGRELHMVVTKRFCEGGVMLLARFVVWMLSIGTLVLGTGVVSCQNYPNKPIRILTPLAGSGGDFIGRILAQGMSGPLGQPVIVDNRNRILATEVVLKAPPDGYTLTIQGPAVWIAPLLEKMPYDAVTDLAPISLIARQVNVLTVHPPLPVKSVKELIALAKARPGELNHGSGGIGTIGHIGVELLKSMAGVNIVWVPYKGDAPAFAALISGEVQLTIADPRLAEPHVKAGRLKALAVTSATPSALVPELPTVASSGLPGYDVVGMNGVWAPARTPEAIVNRLNQEIMRVLNQPEVKQRFLEAGYEVVASSPEQFAATIKADIARSGKIIRDAGIKIN
jgi:tripartite-type tricarboxylate transporter receptor subunit TctC